MRASGTEPSVANYGDDARPGPRTSLSAGFVASRCAVVLALNEMLFEFRATVVEVGRHEMCDSDDETNRLYCFLVVIFLQFIQDTGEERSKEKLRL